MGMPFVGGCASSADEADVAVTLGEADDKQNVGRAETNDDLSLFGFRVVGVGEDASERIEEHRHGFVEGDAVLAEVARSITPIPYEPHAGSPALGVRNAWTV